ncbi:MAG: permease-like cell division protein FtsX [Eubacteriales bacterium]|nr:permease-like cell division protein FtsX [Eubacteriales bacterium]
MGNKGLRYAIRDGFTGLKRHPMVLILSITTMFIMLSLLAAFVVFAYNANIVLKEAGEIPPVEIQFQLGVSQDSVVNLAKQFEDNENIVEYKVMSPADNMSDFMDLMGKEGLFDEFNYEDHIPWTILLRLGDPTLGQAFKNEVMQYPGVYDVMMETALMSTLQSAIQTVSLVSILVFLILFIVSVMVINNMIRIIALSRSNELSIMKTMGATDLYIRIPFVIEGLFVSLLASILSVTAILLAYHFVLNSLAAGFISDSLLPLGQLVLPVVLVVVLLALLVGGLTSFFSVKRYIRV